MILHVSVFDNDTINDTLVSRQAQPYAGGGVLATSKWLSASPMAIEIFVNTCLQELILHTLRVVDKVCMVRCPYLLPEALLLSIDILLSLSMLLPLKL